jgi:hypothetical protein
MLRFASITRMKRLIFLPLFLLPAYILQAQTKIFKEVGEDMSTQIKAIAQDNALVGYLAFTTLEKADADSFNYKLTIMDENLNDIGTVKFRQRVLDLQSVSFEQNILCLGYIQSSITDVNAIRSEKEFKKAVSAAPTSHILLQFISLDGKILNTYYKDVHLSSHLVTSTSRWSASSRMVEHLEYGMQIKNIPNSGFALFYGDDLRRKLVVFDTRGTVTTEQNAPGFADRFYLQASAWKVYLLTKQDRPTPEGGFKLYVYSPKDLVVETSFDLRDRNDNWLKVLSFDTDPATGDAFIAGCIINPGREKSFLTANDYSYTPYLGLFTLDLGNPNKKMYANCSYWSDGKYQDVSEDGFFAKSGFYVRFATAFRDFNGNTIFSGTALEGKGIVGAAKYKFTDGVFVRQEPSGNLALENSIACDETKYFNGGGFLPELDKKDYYKVVNPDTKTNYMIIDDEENIYIYNVNGKKIARTIPHKDGNIRVNVFPAKEGHMLVSEYNRKEKQTRFSIEAL